MEKIRVLIINGNHSIRRGLARIFSTRGNFKILGEVNMDEDIEILQKLQPDVALFYIHQKQDLNDMSFIKKIKTYCPCTLLIAISDCSHHMRAAFLAGADGCLKTPIMPSDIVTAVELSCKSDICFFSKEDNDKFKNLLNFRNNPTGNLENEACGYLL